MEIWRKEKGSTILLAILVLAVGSALVITLAQTKHNTVVSALAGERSTRALDLAESGLETVCQRARAHILDGNNLGSFSINEVTGQFGGGEFTVRTQFISPDSLQITSRGRFEGITRVVREVVEVVAITPPNVINPGIAANGSLVLNTANAGNYYGQNITLNGNAGQLGGIPITLSVPEGGRITNNIGNSPLVTLEYDVEPPPDIQVDMKEIEDYLTSNDRNAIVNSSATWNSDIPSQYQNKPIIFVKGNLTINRTVNIDSHFQNLTIVATGDITLNGHPSVEFNTNGAEFNLLSGGNLTVNGKMEINGNDCQSFIFSEGNMVFNGHPSINNFNCQLRSKGNLTINGEARFAQQPMTINIPGVTIGGQGGNNNGDNGSSQTVFAVQSWQEIDPNLF